MSHPDAIPPAWLSSFRTLASPSLRVALLFRVVLPATAMMALVLIGSLTLMKGYADHEMREQIQLVARGIQGSVQTSLAQHDLPAVRRALESVSHIGRVFGAYVYDAHGKRVAATGHPRPPKHSEKRATIAASLRRQGRFGRVNGRAVYSYFVPLLGHGGQLEGVLQVTRRRSDFRSYAKRMEVWGVSAILVVSLVLAWLILRGHSRAIGVHVKALASAMKRVSQGERDIQTATRGPKELSDLARVFNQMLARLSEGEREIRARAQTERDLQEKLLQERKMAALGRLSAGVAHELAGPLSVIDGRARQLRPVEPENPRFTRSVDGIRFEVKRMTRIIEELLAFSRASRLASRWIDPAVPAHAAIAAVREDRRVPDATITFDHGSANDSTKVLLDAARVEQALTNLIRNAAQARPGARVVVSWRTSDHACIYRVEDNGPGIAADDRARVFEPFFTTKDIGEGTGLGLAVVHGVAEEHHGEVHVEDSRLGGACVCLMLPRRAQMIPADGGC